MKSLTSIVWQMAKVFILFTGSTVLFYYGMMWINEEYENYHRYDQPEGAAVKVFQPVGQKELSFLDRLILFYRDGE
ncbi:YqzK family protein [Bacillus sp. 2205SS5-2]|uniref:YqzK family protein n=1 Tax=Bacillus sp. 2205SS5-2 TaxID=3109031 RepID=UPI003007DA92